jgi:hypothetical protein
VTAPIDLTHYWLNMGCESATIYCFTCGEDIFANPGDRYSLVVENPTIAELIEIASQHHTANHQEQP